MDPFSLLFIALAVYGAMHAAKNGVKVARASAALSRTSAQGKLPKNSPKSIMNDTRRRATAAWWAREIGNGFPATLGGMKQGWHAHQTAAAKHQADARTSQAKMVAAVAAHRARTQAAQKKIDAAKPPAPAGQPAPVPAPRPPAPPVMAPPPPISQTPPKQPAPSQAAGGNGHPVNGQPQTQPPSNPADWANTPGATCSDPTCPYCHVPSGSNGNGGQPTGSPSASAPSTGGTVTDLNYDGIMIICDKVIAHAEHVSNDPALTEAEQMADQLGPMMPDDSESLGMAGDLASAIKAAKDAQARVLEAAQGLKNTVEKNHGAAHEAAQATGHMAEREVHVNG